DNLNFLSLFTKKTTDKGFSLFYKNSKRIDTIEKSDNFAESVIENVLTNEIVVPYVTLCVKNHTDPPWSKMYRLIRKQYGDGYAQLTIMDSKIQWYFDKKDMVKYTRLLISRVKIMGPMGIGVEKFDLNNNAFQVFLYSNDKKDLLTALKWSEKSLLNNNDVYKINCIDTKANLLYKLGRTDEAILLEEKVVVLVPELDEYKDILKKMKRGERTW
ncbi:MAG TPA: hypothetical protein VKR58_03395, partial [Aquella sp.]|nr:hypothetical protein [Aquella sp.]